MIKKVVIATTNVHKVEEIKEIAGDIGIEFVCAPEGFEPVENGETFAENAYIKAREAALMTGMYALGDDSGLCVEAMGGAPGIFSARFARTTKSRIEKLLGILKDVPEEKRGAKFVCSMVLVDPEGRKLKGVDGSVHGTIGFEPEGLHGFGYDPVFFIPAYGKTMAQLPADVKNEISHRAMALKPVIKYILRHNQYILFKQRKEERKKNELY